jgi:hypothetical protein
MSNKPQDDKNVMPTEPNLVAPSYAKEFTKSLGYELRAQHQQGSEPVPVVECYDDGSVNGGLRWIPYTGLNHAIEYGDKFYTAPPQSNALVAAAYRKASEICDECVSFKMAEWSSPQARPLNHEEIKSRLLEAIHADAEAALRERDFALCMKAAIDAYIAGQEHGRQGKTADLDAIVNSVLEGGE